MARRKTKKQKFSTKKYWTIVIGLTAVMLFSAIKAIEYYKAHQKEFAHLTELYEQRKAEDTQPSEKPEPKPERHPKPGKSEPVQEKKVVSKPKETLKASADIYYYTKAFDFHWPAYQSTDQIVEHEHYTLHYIEEYEQPAWVSYKLERNHLTKNAGRSDNFREDPKVHTHSASLADYRKSGYDRGHLAPAADFSWNSTAMSESFYMSNMSPQKPGFNRGIWKKLEAQVREWALKEGELYVVTGPVLKGNLPTIGRNKVAIPEMYYKILLDMREPELKAIAFLIKNESSKAPLQSFAVSIDEVESLTGIDFFPLIPDQLEFELESEKRTDLWF